MAELDPSNTTIGDICKQVLRESGWLGQGNEAGADDLQDTQVRLMWMLQQWERKRWLVYHLVELVKASTGAASYSIGDGGDFNSGSPRPDKIESAFIRLLTNPGNPVDYPIRVIDAGEDYGEIALKSMSSMPEAVFLDTGWPNGTVKFWPVPQSGLYELHLLCKCQLSSAFAAKVPATKINLPFEYYAAILYNLALRMRQYYRVPAYAGDQLPALAKDALATLRGANVQIKNLDMPVELSGNNRYNIFSDESN